MVDLAQTIEEWKDLCSVKVDDQVKPSDRAYIFECKGLVEKWIQCFPVNLRLELPLFVRHQIYLEEK